jgi:hypothetical protein
MSNHRDSKVSEPAGLALDALLLTILLLAGVLAIIAGLLGASWPVLGGGMVALILGIYLFSVVDKYRLPTLKMPNLGPRLKRYAEKFKIDPQAEAGEAEPAGLPLDALILTVLFLAGMLAVIAGLVGASGPVLAGGIVGIAVGIYLYSLTNTYRLPSLKWPQKKAPIVPAYDHKFEVDQTVQFTDAAGSYPVRITHRLVEGDELQYRVEVLTERAIKVIYCSEQQLSPA